MTDTAHSLGRQETATLEFKRDAHDRHALRKAICAFANDLSGSGGGVLLIGVGADGSACPLATGDQALLAVTNLRDDGKILDRPSLVVSVAEWDGIAIIRVDVAASVSPPVRLDGVVWVRPGPTTRRAGADDERVLSERRLSLALPFDARAVPGATLDDLDLELLSSTYVPAAVDTDVLRAAGLCRDAAEHAGGPTCADIRPLVAPAARRLRRVCAWFPARQREP